MNCWEDQTLLHLLDHYFASNISYNTTVMKISINIFPYVLIFAINISTLTAQIVGNNSLKVDTLTIHMRGDTSVTLAMLYYIDSMDEYFNWGGTIYPKVISQSICIVVDGIVVGGKHLDSLPIDKHAKIKEGIQRLPIIDISLYKGNDSNYYFILYGAALCCGMECPEYFGVFESNGTLLYEVIAANNYQYDKHFKSLDDFCRCKGIDERFPLKKRSFY